VLFGHGFSIHYGECPAARKSTWPCVAHKGTGHIVRPTVRGGIVSPVSSQSSRTSTGDAMGVAGLRHGDRRAPGAAFSSRRASKRDRDRPVRREECCEGVTELVQRGHETLTEAGMTTRLADFAGPARAQADRRPHVREGESAACVLDRHTAEYGEMTRGSRSSAETRGGPAADEEGVGGDPVREFAREWIARTEAGPGELQAACAESRPASGAGRGKEMRAQMDWIDTIYRSSSRPSRRSGT